MSLVADAEDKAYEDGYDEGYEHAIQNMTWNLDWVGHVKPDAFCPMGPHKIGRNAGSCEFCTGVLPLVNR